MAENRNLSISVRNIASDQISPIQEAARQAQAISMALADIQIMNSPSPRLARLQRIAGAFVAISAIFALLFLATI